MERDEEIFVDAEEEVTPRRTGRKRRSTAGSSVPPTVVKKPKTKMPTRHSPRREAGASAKDNPGAGAQMLPSQGPDQDAFWAKMGGMLGGMEARMKLESDQMKEQLAVAVDAVGALGTRMDKAERRLCGLVDEVNSIVDKRISDLPARSAAMAGPPGPGPGPSYVAALISGSPGGSSGAVQTWKSAKSPGKRREESYWECRRALRLRPVPAGDPIAAVKRFMTDELKLSQSFMESVGDFRVRRVPSGPAARVRDEVVVSYQSTDVRDAVKSAARNLAGKGPEYGVRLELPDHLKSDMKALQAVSYEIKKKYPMARRNVLFEDERMDLVLDFCVSEGAPWRRMSSHQARARKKKTPGPTSKLPLDDSEIDKLLDDPADAEDDDPADAEDDHTEQE